MLPQEFDFAIVVRKGKQHYMVDHLSRIWIGEPPEGVNDELPDATLFKVDHCPEWYLGLVEYLMIGRPRPDMSKVDARKLIRFVGPYQLIVKQLYVRGKDDIIRRCALPHEVDSILFQAHDGIAGGHFASELMARKVLQARLWWPTLFKDAHQYVL